MTLHGYPDNSAPWYSIQVFGSNYALSPHFKLREFACKDGNDELRVHPALLKGLEKLRTHFGNRPVTINSAYRTAEHNAAEKGHPNSRHLYGLAADIVIRGVDPDFVAKVANLEPFGGVGQYTPVTHVDVSRATRRWEKRKWRKA